MKCIQSGGDANGFSSNCRDRPDTVAKKGIDKAGGRKTIEAMFAVARSAELTPEEKVLWFLYRSYDHHGEGSFPGDSKLAAHMGKIERSVQNYRAELLRKGWLKQTKRYHKPALYFATIPAEVDSQAAANPPEIVSQSVASPSSDGPSNGTVPEPNRETRDGPLVISQPAAISPASHLAESRKVISHDSSSHFATLLESNRNPLHPPYKE